MSGSPRPVRLGARPETAGRSAIRAGHFRVCGHRQLQPDEEEGVTFAPIVACRPDIERIKRISQDKKVTADEAPALTELDILNDRA